MKNKFNKEDWFSIIYSIILYVVTFCCIMMGVIGGKRWIGLRFLKSCALQWIVKIMKMLKFCWIN